MSHPILALADLTVGVALAAAGAVVLIAHKERRIGLLLWVACGTWFAGNLFAPLVFLHRGPMVHLHLSYPTGRLHRWPALAATGAAYAWAVVEGWFPAPWPTAALSATVALAATDGYRHTRGPARRAARPGFVAALMFATVLALSAANLLLDIGSDAAVALVYDLVMVVVPTWLAVDLIRGGWTEATLADLVTQLGGSPEGVGLEAELRRAIGDPGLVLGYWDDPTHRYLDAAGRPVDAAGPGVTRVDEDGRPVAVLVHDLTLLADPVLLDGAIAALGLAVSNVRMRAEVRDRAARLVAARRRLVEVADEQHRALQDELAAGPQAQLTRALDALAVVDPAVGSDVRPVRAGIDAAREELHRLAQGLRPEALEREGLSGAVAILVERCRLPVTVRVDVGRLRPAVESAVWFVCAEALTNAVKHARATAVRVGVGRINDDVVVSVTDDGIGGAQPSGSGLGGLSDRVAALGGVLTVADGAHGGTAVTARIPVGGTA